MADNENQKESSDKKPQKERRSGKERREAKVERRGDDRVETELDPRRCGEDRRKD